ncbi:MAG: nucleoside-diphosphate sugar epimerase/dehydratase [Syntrophaceae bacterium]
MQADKETDNSIFQELLRPTMLKRFLFFFVGDTILITLSLYLAFLFHFDFTLTINYGEIIIEVLPYFMVIKLISLVIFRTYRITWRFIGLYDLLNIALAIMFAGFFLVVLSLYHYPSFELPLTGFPKRVIFADCVFSLFLISFLRISKRLYNEVLRKKTGPADGKKTLIVGAGNAGEMILRDMSRQEGSSYFPVCLLDDDTMKVGTYLRGVKVMGTTANLGEMISRFGIDTVIIAIPSLNHQTLQTIYKTAKKAGVQDIKVIPRIYNFSRPEVSLKGLEEISIEDLIGRQIVSVDTTEIEKFLKDRPVLVTGAGGSIGSEIVMQAASFGPESLVIFDSDETELHNLGIRLKRRFPHLMDSVHFVTGDIRDESRVTEVFAALKPLVVFHAAALKHVPMMEFNPTEAVKVNMFGTYSLVKTAAANGVEKFIMISTDKAVRPTSVMGATKRMAECICRAFSIDSDWGTGSNGQLTAATQFISVRFGNVLGSRGSVLPLFMDQIKHGGPLTVTHPDMRRYFMTIPEAVTLVLQAAVIGRGGDILVLDMGQPVNISRFAEELIRIHGMEPYKDINIEFTGLRPGEKLFEEILTAEEGTDASRHEKIFIARNRERYSREEIEEILSRFDIAIRESSFGERTGIRELLRKYVKHYVDEKH